MPVPDPMGTVDLSTVDWNALAAIHSFRFRTSRWDDLDAHLLAHLVVDEILDGDPDLGSIDVAAPEIRDDVELEDVLHGRLGAVPRAPASTPEIARLWRAGGTGPMTYEVVGLLIDGPEPVAAPGAVITVLDANAAPVPVVLRAGTSGTRALLLFRSGTSAVAAPQGSLTVTVNDGVEVVGVEVAVGAAPAFLAEEMAP